MDRSLEQGMQQGIYNITKKSILKGLDIVIISELTGLSINEIKKIKNKNINSC